METYTNRGSGVSHQRERLYTNFFIENLVHKLLTIVTRFPVKKHLIILLIIELKLDLVPVSSPIIQTVNNA